MWKNLAERDAACGNISRCTSVVRCCKQIVEDEVEVVGFLAGLATTGSSFQYIVRFFGKRKIKHCLISWCPTGWVWKSARNRFGFRFPLGPSL